MAGSASPSDIRPASTARYSKKRDAIIAAASRLINRHGVSGMTLSAVGAEVGLITNSVTYYFKKKEDLALACYLDGAARLTALLKEALKEEDPPRRVKRFLALCLDAQRLVRAGAAAPFPYFNDVRALPEERGHAMRAPFAELYSGARDLFRGEGYEWIGGPGRLVRAGILLEYIYWLPAWLEEYDLEDMPRVGARICDVLLGGIAAPGFSWEARPLIQPPEPEADKQQRARDAYLMAATKLINQHGYRGVSVRNISAELNFTTGAFYHHHDAKSDIVIACFERSFEVMRRLQHCAIDQTENKWQALCAASAAIVDYQISEHGPLLRSAALTAVPEEIREELMHHSNRVSMRFAGMISDGVADGVLRAVDPSIASQMLHAALNAAAELPFWVPELDRTRAARLFARPMLMGLFTR